jgi:hypothetical protein
MVESHKVSQRQVCKACPQAVFSTNQRTIMPMIEDLEALVAKHSAIGFWPSFFRLGGKGGHEA